MGNNKFFANLEVFYQIWEIVHNFSWTLKYLPLKDQTQISAFKGPYTEIIGLVTVGQKDQNCTSWCLLACMTPDNYVILYFL